MDGKLRNMTALYLVSGDKMLLLYRIGSRVFKKPVWCGIGGHFEKEELNDARAALLREVEEEIGLHEEDLEELRLRYITLRRKNGEIRQNYYFFARLAPGAVLSDTGDDRTMPHTASFVVKHYLETGRWQDTLYCCVADRENAQFLALEEFEDRTRAL